MSDAPQTFRREIDLGDGSGKQVFEGATEAELSDKLATAQMHASKKIREQAQLLQTREQELAELQSRMTPKEEPVPEGGFDRQAYFAKLYEDPMAANDMYLERRFGMPVDELRGKLQRMDEAAVVLQQRKAIESVGARYPMFAQLSQEDNNANGIVIDKILKEHGWELDEGHLEAAILMAKERKLLKMPVEGERIPAEEPPATLGGSNTGATANGGFNEEEFKRTATADQWRTYLKQKYAGARIGA